MIDKLKVCMLGASAVGKTSLVSRFVENAFEARYSSTIGVKIQARRVRRGDDVATLVLWDLSGEDEFQAVQPAYLRGAAGYLLVIDGTRRDTFDTALELEARVRGSLGSLPFVVLLNKADLIASWDLGRERLQQLAQLGWRTIRTSAKTGQHVEEAFNAIAEAALPRWGRTWSATR